MTQYFLIASLSVLTLCGCSDADGTSKKVSRAADTAKVDKTEKPKTSFVNGITDANSGVKKGPITFSGAMPSGTNSGKMYLYELEGNNAFVIDSVNVKTGKFSFGTKDYESGFYQLAYQNDKNITTIILNPDEPEVEISFKTARLANGFTSSNSKENQGYAIYEKQETAILTKIRAYRKSANKSAVKAKFEKLIEAEETTLRNLQQKLIADYPGTFLAKIMTLKQSPNKNDKSRYWDDVDFTDESIIHSPIIPDRVQEYMQLHAGGTETGFLNGIDLITQKAEVNDRLKSFSILTLLEGFYSTGRDDICTYIMDNYVYGENCGSGDYADLLKDRATGVRNLQLGSIPPDFTIEKWDGGKLNLYSEVAKSEFTLVLFWSSWCHKCEQEIPVLKNVYETYKGRGFRVVGVSVDTDRNAWINAVKENDTPWPNVSQLNAWASPVAKDYRVNATPTLFLLNKNREIVLKPERIFEVENYIKQNI